MKGAIASPQHSRRPDSKLSPNASRAAAEQLPPPRPETPLPAPQNPFPLPPQNNLLQPPAQSPVPQSPPGTAPANIRVNEFRFIGNTAFSSKTLAQVLARAGYTNKLITFGQLLQARNAIKDLLCQ